jgi:Lhr-like helicase
MGLWHGDVKMSGRRNILAERPDILLTTPESLESMLVSTKVDHRAFFAGLRTVIVDEVHAFAGDDRGWHLLAVLERLTGWSGDRCSGSACPRPSATRGSCWNGCKAPTPARGRPRSWPRTWRSV